MYKYIMLCILILVFVFSGFVHAGEENDIIWEQIFSEYEQLVEAEEEKQEKLKNDIFETVDKFVNRHSEKAKVYFEAAEICIILAQFENKEEEKIDILNLGKEYAEKAVQLFPDEARSYYWQAVLKAEIIKIEGGLSSLAKIESVRDKLERVIDLESDYAPAYDALAQLYLIAPGWPLSIGDVDKALEYRKESVELEPDSLDYRWKLYENQMEAGNEEGGRKELKYILQKTEDSEKEYEQRIRERAKNELE